MPIKALIFKAAVEQRVKNARVVKVDRRTTAAEYEQLLGGRETGGNCFDRAVRQTRRAQRHSRAAGRRSRIYRSSNFGEQKHGNRRVRLPVSVKTISRSEKLHGGVGGRRCRADRRQRERFSAKRRSPDTRPFPCRAFSKSATACR